MRPLLSMKASGLKLKANGNHTLQHESLWVADAYGYLTPLYRLIDW